MYDYKFFLTIFLARLEILWLVLFFATMIIRIIARKTKNKGLAQFNAKLKKPHKLFGFLFVLGGLVHGLLSTEKFFELGSGQVLLILAVITALIYRFRGALGKKWLLMHRSLAVGVVVLLAIHIILQGGFYPSLLPPLEPVQKGGSASQLGSLSQNKPTGKNQGIYKDGIFTGSEPGISVTVTIKDNTIVDITYSAKGNNYKTYEEDVRSYLSSFIGYKLPEVDAISSATRHTSKLGTALQSAINSAKK